MMFDKRIGPERSQFAAQSSEISEELLKEIKQLFGGNESIEFYEGLLAGYACCYQIIRQGKTQEDKIALIGAIVAYVSDVLEERI